MMALKILTLVLLMSQPMMMGASLNTNELLDSSQQAGTGNQIGNGPFQGRQAAMESAINSEMSDALDIQGNRDNVKRYIVRELDVEGYTLQPPDWRVIGVNRLLENLGANLVSQNTLPMYRSSRTLPFSENRASALRKTEALKQQQQQQALATMVMKPPLAGFNWPPVGVENGGRSVGRYNNWIGNQPHKQKQSSLASTSLSSHEHQQPHRSIGSDEVAIHTPMHSPLINDHDWKRVENNRWTTLRGMWGKRASGVRQQSLADPINDVNVLDDSFLAGEQ